MESKLIEEGITVRFPPLTRKVFAVMVIGSIGLLKVARKETLSPTRVDPSVGAKAVTVGRTLYQSGRCRDVEIVLTLGAGEGIALRVFNPVRKIDAVVRIARCRKVGARYEADNVRAQQR